MEVPKKIQPYLESWQSFGDNLNEFIEKHNDDLIKDSFDLILGFTRGGYIVALALSALLRDKFKEAYDIEEKPYKASVRAIPSGITTKRYRHPCFVMHDAASKEDMEDLRSSLEYNLREFKKTIEEENFQKIDKVNVLLVDDNLTGSTRLLTFAKEMRKWDFLDVKTLCYVRHKAFEIPKFDYEISKFPQNYDYFVMPWHVEEKPKDLNIDRPVQRFAFKCKLNSTFDINKFQRRLRMLIPSYQHEFTYSNTNIYIFNRGETYVEMQLNEDEISFRYIYNKFYPPKRCLIQREPGFKKLIGMDKALSFCEDDSNLILHTNTCLVCAFLNCNRDFLESIIIENEPVNKLIISPIYEQTPDNQEQLIELINKWFGKSFPHINVTK
ncbi:MAG: hypothetical protein A7315_05220 [Candidatus Altiarchaeales archaeon WOR_SM1_79]|nr:MAG: hypothetical protein A7315_05220 [Candidatus Altiarchaeales archaeon WOR_SM1_79]